MRIKLLVLLLLISNLSFSQKIKDQWVSFSYNRLPYKPLDNQIKSYQSKLISWEDDAASQLQQQYESELETYRTNYKLAQDLYKKEMAEYNRKSRLEKVVDKELLDQEKPVFTPPVYPEFTELPKSLDNENLASKYLILDGYDKGIYNPVFITVQLKPFEMDEITSTSKTTGEGEKQKTTTTYTTKYKQPVKVTIESTINGVLYDEVFPNSINKQSYYRTKEITYNEIKEYAVNKMLNEISYFINSNYGKTKIDYTTSVVVIEKYKKYKYTEHEEALIHALSGYKNIYLEKNKSISSFNKAINIWENILNQYEPNNKKAKINSEVAWYTMLNIAEAYLWIENFDKAEEYFNKMEINTPKKGNRRFFSSKNKLKEKKERFFANKRQ